LLAVEKSKVRPSGRRRAHGFADYMLANETKALFDADNQSLINSSGNQQ
jgi:hypothetical protein